MVVMVCFMIVLIIDRQMDICTSRVTFVTKNLSEAEGG